MRARNRFQLRFATSRLCDLIQVPARSLLLKVCQEVHEGRVIAPSLLSTARTQLIELRTETLRSEPQIPTRRVETHLTNVRRKRRKHSVQIGAVPDPCCYPMYRKSVPEIMQAGLVACTVVTLNPGHGTQPLKRLL